MPSSTRSGRAKPSSNKAVNEGLPLMMATPIISLHDLGRIIAEQSGIAPGIYEVVAEYKVGPCRLGRGEDARAAMGVSFGGLGLRATEEENPMTIVVGETTKTVKRASASRKRVQPS